MDQRWDLDSWTSGTSHRMENRITDEMSRFLSTFVPNPVVVCRYQAAVPWLRSRSVPPPPLWETIASAAPTLKQIRGMSCTATS